MAYKVVRPFAYGADGIHAVELVVGDEREDFGSSTAGLLFEKYIEEIEAKVTEPEGEPTATEPPVGDVPELAIDADDDATAEDTAPRRGRRRK